MPSTFIRTLIVALAIATLGAPSALARPADTPLSVARSAVAAQGPHDARPVDTPGSENRAELGSLVTLHARSTPDAAAGPGSAWSSIGLGAAGLLAVGAMVAIASRTRRTARARIVA